MVVGAGFYAVGGFFFSTFLETSRAPNQTTCEMDVYITAWLVPTVFLMRNLAGSDL